MAFNESSQFWTTGSTGDGASSYTAAQWATMLQAMFQSNAATEGILAVSGGQLVVSSPANNQTQVMDGYALVAGMFYKNLSQGTLSVTSPTSGTTGYRVVLRANYSAQTVRITLIASPDGNSSIPALVQTANTTWDIPLASFQITTGGAIQNLTDNRTYCHFNTRVNSAMLDSGSVGSSQIAAGAVGNTQLASGSVSDSNVNSGISSSKLSAGTNSNFVVGSVRVQTGVFATTSKNFQTINFPTAFSGTPVLLCQNIDPGNTQQTINVFSLSSTSAAIYIYDSASTGQSMSVQWIAIGPV